VRMSRVSFDIETPSFVTRLSFEDREAGHDSWVSVRDAESVENVWTFKSTVAFWAAVYFVIGSALFVIGSIALYPGVCPDVGYVRAWVDYPFMVGAWCFTAGNYAVYFQVINRLSSHGASDNSAVNHVHSTRWLIPERADVSLGYWACVFNLIGSLFYNFNTMGMYEPLEGYKKTPAGYNLVYVMSGSVGSACFILAAILEGEYNQWRKCSWQTLTTNWPVLMSCFSLIGGVLFFVGYISDLNHFVEEADTRARTIELVATPFTIGSLFFLASSWMMQVMWKARMFGLGFAKELTNRRSDSTVSRSQQIMMLFYCMNLGMCWLLLGKLLGGDGAGWYKDVGDIGWLCNNVLLRIAAYNTIIVLASIVHGVPPDCPYPCMFWTMRITTICDFCSSIAWLAHENPSLFASEQAVM